MSVAREENGRQPHHLNSAINNAAAVEKEEAGSVKISFIAQMHFLGYNP